MPALEHKHSKTTATATSNDTSSAGGVVATLTRSSSASVAQHDSAMTRRGSNSSNNNSKDKPTTVLQACNGNTASSNSNNNSKRNTISSSSSGSSPPPQQQHQHTAAAAATTTTPAIAGGGRGGAAATDTSSVASTATTKSSNSSSGGASGRAHAGARGDASPSLPMLAPRPTAPPPPPPLQSTLVRPSSTNMPRIGSSGGGSGSGGSSRNGSTVVSSNPSPSAATAVATSSSLSAAAGAALSAVTMTSHNNNNNNNSSGSSGSKAGGSHHHSADDGQKRNGTSSTTTTSSRVVHTPPPPPLQQQQQQQQQQPQHATKTASPSSSSSPQPPLQPQQPALAPAPLQRRRPSSTRLAKARVSNRVAFVGEAIEEDDARAAAAAAARSALDAEVKEEYGGHLSRRAIRIIQRVNDILRRCTAAVAAAAAAASSSSSSTAGGGGGGGGRGSSSSNNGAAFVRVTDEELAMFATFKVLRSSPIGALYLSHPEVTLSNRSCVITTPGFHRDEVVYGYELRGVFSPGTIGRSYFATLQHEQQQAQQQAQQQQQQQAQQQQQHGGAALHTPSSLLRRQTTTTTSNAHANDSTAATTTTRARSQAALTMSAAAAAAAAATSSSGSNTTTNAAVAVAAGGGGGLPAGYVLKEVGFVLRRHLFEAVMREQRVLVNINYDNIIKICDVLNDDVKENMIVITRLQPRGNITRYAGRLDDEPDKLRRILRDVGVALRILHSHKIYHHNIKLENVLETSDGHYCLVDNGFARLFTAQCPEALVFNGELACLPPEVFDEDGLYASERYLDGDDDGGGGGSGKSGNSYASNNAAAAAAVGMLTLGVGEARSGSMATLRSMSHVTENASCCSSSNSGAANATPALATTTTTTPTVAVAATTTATTTATATAAATTTTPPRGSTSYSSSSSMGSSLVNSSLAAVDLWGFGVLMYRLAYGAEPITIAELPYEEVRERVLACALHFPARPHWPFARDLEDIITLCLSKKPSQRPTAVKLLLHPFFRDMLAQSVYSQPRTLLTVSTSSTATTLTAAGATTTSLYGGGGGGGGAVTGSSNSNNNNNMGAASGGGMMLTLPQPTLHHQHSGYNNSGSAATATAAAAASGSNAVVGSYSNHSASPSQQHLNLSVSTLTRHTSAAHARNLNGYTADAILGRGRFCETLLVHLRRNPSECFAFKLVTQSVLKRIEAMGSFDVAESIRRQLAITRKISHANVVRCYDIVDGKRNSSGGCFVVQEYMEGGKLTSIPPLASRPPRASQAQQAQQQQQQQAQPQTASSSSPSPAPTLQDFLLDVLRGLVHLHDNGIAHLSLTPHNIFYCAKSRGYKIADYGPVFVTAKELVKAHNAAMAAAAAATPGGATAAAAPAPSRSASTLSMQVAGATTTTTTTTTELLNLPQWLWDERPLNAYHVDSFCVGLLAASVVPHVYERVWADLLHAPPSRRPFAVADTLRLVKAAGVPDTLLRFVKSALTAGQDARKMMLHPFFEGRVSPKSVPVEKIYVSTLDVARAVQPRPGVCDEPRMRDVLGIDAMQESQLISFTGDLAGWTEVGATVVPSVTTATTTGNTTMTSAGVGNMTAAALRSTSTAATTTTTTTTHHTHANGGAAGAATTATAASMSNSNSSSSSGAMMMLHNHATNELGGGAAAATATPSAAAATTTTTAMTMMMSGVPHVLSPAVCSGRHTSSLMSRTSSFALVSSSATLGNTPGAAQGGGNGAATAPLVLVEDCVVYTFRGPNLRCSQCGVDILVTLFKCTVCEDCVRCGKCAVYGTHKDGHPLVPYIVYLIEHDRDDTSRATLMHPSRIQDAHTLEELEMRENLPVGALLGHMTSQRAAQRGYLVVTESLLTSHAHNNNATAAATAHTASANNNNNNNSGARSAPSLHDGGESEPNLHETLSNFSSASTTTTMTTAAANVRSSISLRHHSTVSSSTLTAALPDAMYGNNNSSGSGGAPMLNVGNATSLNSTSNLVVSVSPTLSSGYPMGSGGSGGTTSGSDNNNNNKASRMLMKPARKMVLPKAEELDDDTWQQELERCRELHLTELLLYNYALDTVPHEVYDPPPLQVVLLDLSKNNLTALPHELSFLVHLRKLVVSYNKLVDLPESLGNLGELEILDVSHNQLTDLPQSFIYLTRLESIAMDYNDCAAIPDSILDILPTASTASAPFDDVLSTHYGGNLARHGGGGDGGGRGASNHDYDAFANPLHAVSSSHNSSNASSGSSSASGSYSHSRHDDNGDDMDEAMVVDGNGNNNNNQAPSLSVQLSFSEQALSSMVAAPRLSAVYLAANERLTTFPDVERLRRFTALKIALDNEPSLYQYCTQQLDLEKQLPNVTISWNKIYPDEIIPHLFCGSLRSAQSQIVYKKLKISYVLTVGRELVPVPPEGGKHKVIVVDDIPGADIMSSMREAVAFIDESQARGEGCLVHCFAGLSRSATTVIAYLMLRKQMRLDEAYLVTKRGRPAIFPNKGFLEQLKHLDAHLFPDDPRPLDLASLGRPPE